MPSYYVPSQGSHRSHHDAYAPPVVYTASHHGYPPPQADPYAGQYLGVPGSQTIYVPSSSGRSRSRSRSRSRRHHHYEPQVVTTGGVAILPDRRHRSYHRLSLGERIRRFFGFAPRHHGVKIKSSHSNWGFLGRSRRRRYVDAQTGIEVDKRGRPIYRV